jgi:hypothetical protein
MAEIKENTMDKVEAEVRVTSLKVKPFAYKDGKDEMVGGESMEMRAEGFWVGGKDHFPISLHVTVPPGHAVVPAIGDCVSVIVQRK